LDETFGALDGVGDERKYLLWSCCGVAIFTGTSTTKAREQLVICKILCTLVTLLHLVVLGLWSGQTFGGGISKIFGSNCSKCSIQNTLMKSFFGIFLLLTEAVGAESEPLVPNSRVQHVLSQQDCLPN
jgi:hypothetical protein